MEKQLKRNRSYWSKEEDEKLWREVFTNRNRNSWRSVARNAGLNRSGNACRLRWLNHLKLGYRPGRLTDEEKLLILEFRSRFGKNCWAEIARHLLPGRRDNDIKNFWHTMAKRAKLENGDVDSKAEVKKTELVEKITAAGKLTMGTSLISPNAYTILSTLLPSLALEAASSNAAGGAVAGGGAAAAAAAAASFPTAVYIVGADAAYSADVGPDMEVRHIFPIDPSWDYHILPDNVVLTGTAHGPNPNEWEDFLSCLNDGGFDQAAAASMRGASNDTGNPHNSYTGVDGGVYQWGPASAAARV